PVPLNTKLGPETLAYILKDSGCVGAVIESATNPVLRRLVDEQGCGFRIGFEPAEGSWLNYETALQASAPEFEPAPLAKGHLSFLPYTSGSTGLPKGVALTHSGQDWWIGCLKKYWPIKPGARALTGVPLYHKNAMAGAIKPMLAQGGSVVLL